MAGPLKVTLSVTGRIYCIYAVDYIIKDYFKSPLFFFFTKCPGVFKLQPFNDQEAKDENGKALGLNPK